jgi:hypothetical protein
MVAYVSIRTILAGKSLHTTGSSQPAPSTLDQIDHFHFHFPVATNKKSPTAKLMPLSRSRFTCFCKMEDSWDGGTLHPSCHTSSNGGHQAHDIYMHISLHHHHAPALKDGNGNGNAVRQHMVRLLHARLKAGVKRSLSSLSSCWPSSWLGFSVCGVVISGRRDAHTHRQRWRVWGEEHNSPKCSRSRQHTPSTTPHHAMQVMLSTIFSFV